MGEATLEQSLEHLPWAQWPGLRVSTGVQLTKGHRASRLSARHRSWPCGLATASDSEAYWLIQTTLPGFPS